MRGEEADGVVAPVVPEPSLHQVGVVHEVVDRLQLDGGDAEAQQVVDRCRMGQAGIGASQRLRHRRVGGGEALDVQLVDDRLAHRTAG